MSLADHIFIDMCRDILEHGVSTEGEKVRPHWEDGTSAYTIKKFGVVNRYDLSKEFPAITLRSKAVPMKCSGSGRRNPITSASCTAISGMSGRMRQAPSAKPTDTRWQ